MAQGGPVEIMSIKSLFGFSMFVFHCFFFWLDRESPHDKKSCSDVFVDHGVFVFLHFSESFSLFFAPKLVFQAQREPEKELASEQASKKLVPQSGIRAGKRCHKHSCPYRC